MELQQYLSPITREESDEYRHNVPLIFFHLVEIHLAIRVCRQFRRIIGYPPPLYSTNQKLHGCIIRHHKVTIVRCACGRTKYRFVAGLTTGRGTRIRIGA